MCPKKAKTMTELLDQIAILWLAHRAGILEKWLERAKDVEKSSDKNMSTGVPTARKQSKKKRHLEKKSRKQ